LKDAKKLVRPLSVAVIIATEDNPQRGETGHDRPLLTGKRKAVRRSDLVGIVSRRPLGQDSDQKQKPGRKYDRITGQEQQHTPKHQSTVRPHRPKLFCKHCSSESTE
jgi:hypothetical protein